MRHELSLGRNVLLGFPHRAGRPGNEVQSSSERQNGTVNGSAMLMLLHTWNSYVFLSPFPTGTL